MPLLNVFAFYEHHEQELVKSVTISACEFAHFSAVDIVDMSGNVEVSEMITFDPDFSDVVAVTANVQEQEEQVDDHHHHDKGESVNDPYGGMSSSNNNNNNNNNKAQLVRIFHSPSATTFVTQDQLETGGEKKSSLTISGKEEHHQHHHHRHHHRRHDPGNGGGGESPIIPAIPNVPKPPKKQFLLHSTSMSSDEVDFSFPTSKAGGGGVNWPLRAAFEESETGGEIESDDKLLDVDWEMLGSPSTTMMRASRMDSKRHSARKKSNTFPRRKCDTSAASFLTSNDDLDSDGTAGSSSCDGGGQSGGIKSSYAYDNDDIVVPYIDGGSIQEAIRMQEQLSSTPTPSHHHHHHTIRAASSSTPSPIPPIMTQAPPAGSGVRLPRGRHPLRGPFGKMLDAQMNKRETTTTTATAGMTSSTTTTPPPTASVTPSHVRTRSTPSGMLKAGGQHQHAADALPNFPGSTSDPGEDDQEISALVKKSSGSFRRRKVSVRD